MPGGTVGGRKQPTRTPASRQAAAASTATCGSPRITDTTADCGTVATPQMAASASAWRNTAAGRSGSAASTPSAARAAPTAAGVSPVSKMNDRALSIRCARTAVGPSTAPPCPPSALDSVVVTTTSGAPANPSSATSPRPPVPRTPSPCASSTISRAPWRRQTACSSRSGARPPSALNTDSVSTTARSSVRAARAAATASTSRCAVTVTRARESRQASTSDAWQAASETTSVPGPDRLTTAPRLAV